MFSRAREFAARARSHHGNNSCASIHQNAPPAPETWAGSLNLSTWSVVENRGRYRRRCGEDHVHVYHVTTSVLRNLWVGSVFSQSSRPSKAPQIKRCFKRNSPITRQLNKFDQVPATFAETPFALGNITSKNCVTYWKIKRTKIFTVSAG